jgi:ribonuclease R
MDHRILKSALERECAKAAGEPPLDKLHFTFPAIVTATITGDEPDKKMAKALREAKLSSSKSEQAATQPELYSAESLEAIAAHSSETERRADDVERELIDLKKLEFMADKLGEEYEGIVIHITKEGMLVELIDLFVEGFVKLATLHDDDYQFKERPIGLVGRISRKTYRLGDRLKVCVDRIDRFRKRVDLSVIEKVKAPLA